MMLIGKRISGRYEVKRLIGGGGMANVYLARDMILERDVAIKVLRLEFSNEEEFIRRFQREAQSATSLNHENIVNIYDVGDEGDINYIVMEYVDGMTLKEYIQNFHPIPLETAIDIMKQLTSAISHAHENQIVHRDIKPQNILIDNTGHVKITDFGIAMALTATSITQTNSVLGSVHYLSPEQARGGLATYKSDIYSLGIVMFELLTGRLPFFGESAISIALKHLQSNTPSLRRWNPDIPQSVENIVMKATAKDPFLRYESAEEMYRDLETALDPSRANEEKFIIPEDHEATKAIPIINNDELNNVDEVTIVHTKEESDNEKVKKKRKVWPWIVGSIGFLAITAIIVISVILPYMLEAQNVTIPDVSGEAYDDAVILLVESGLIIGEVYQEPSEEMSEGEIIRTNPKTGRVVKKGSKIDLYVSSGREKFKIDDYTNRQFDEIVQFLLNQNFVETNIRKEEKHDESPEGTILDQSLTPGTEVIPEETVITFTVSKGVEKIVLRDLRGYNTKGLESYIESTGLNIDMTKEEYSDEVPAGLVISQDPEPGTELKKGDQVTVVISKGPEEIPPKVVKKEIQIPYDPVEEGEEQEVKILIDDFYHNMTIPADTFIITEPRVIEIELTIEKGKTAGYKVVIDNKVLIEEIVEYPENG